MKKFFDEFKEFALKGNAFELAVGVIIGAAFQSIIKSLVSDIISPVLGLFVRQNFNNLSVSFFGITLRYGAFITEVINFIIMAFVIFVFIKLINKLTSFGKRREEPEQETEPEPKICPYCREEVSSEATRCPHCTSELSE